MSSFMNTLYFPPKFSPHLLPRMYHFTLVSGMKWIPSFLSPPIICFLPFHESIRIGGNSSSSNHSSLHFMNQWKSKWIHYLPFFQIMLGWKVSHLMKVWTRPSFILILINILKDLLKKLYHKFFFIQGRTKIYFSIKPIYHDITRL
jgi:hypothetical protein